MTNIITHDIDTSRINLTQHSFIHRLDMISIRDHRGSFDNALVIAAFPNKPLWPIYLDITIMLDGKIQQLSVNKYNITEQKKLFSAYTIEKFSGFKRLFTKPLPIKPGDFVLDKNNNLWIVSELKYKCERGLFVVLAADPNQASNIPEKELQLVNNVRLNFVKLENMYDLQRNWRYRRTI